MRPLGYLPPQHPPLWPVGWPSPYVYGPPPGFDKPRAVEAEADADDDEEEANTDADEQPSAALAPSSSFSTGFGTELGRKAAAGLLFIGASGAGLALCVLSGWVVLRLLKKRYARWRNMEAGSRIRVKPIEEPRVAPASVAGMKKPAPAIAPRARRLPPKPPTPKLVQLLR